MKRYRSLPWFAVMTSIAPVCILGSALNGVYAQTEPRVSAKVQAFTVLHSFDDINTLPNQGSSPYGSLALSGQILYGMTNKGGANNHGTIFSLPSVPLSTISGAVTTSEGAGPMPGVKVSLSQPPWTIETTTNRFSKYFFTDLAPGKYTIVPSLKGYAFSPGSAAVAVGGNDAISNFTGTQITISGAVKIKGAPVSTDLTVQLSGASSGAYTPDASGYIFNGLANGTYKVTSTLTTHHTPVPTASPASATIIINGKGAKQNFTYNTNTTCAKCH